MTLFITGDRSNDMLNTGFVAVEMLRALAKGEDLMTGDNAGVERFVRDIAAHAEVPLLVVESPRTEQGYVDWDKRHTAFTDEVRVLFIHNDPQASRIGRSLLQNLPEDRLQLLVPLSEIILSAGVEVETD